MPDDLERRLDFTRAVAAEASEFILRFYRQSDLVVDSKRDSSPVTEADRGAEQLIRKRIAETYPGDAILGEEFGEQSGTTGYRWILDPVDGTKAFIHGVPLFGTLVGLEYQDRCVLGLCRLPALNEVVYAATGYGAWWQIGDEPPRPARVSAVGDLKHATFCTTDLNGYAIVGKEDVYQWLVNAVSLARGWGDCYGYVLVATGRADVMVDPRMNPWDVAALIPILQEAGGHMVDWTGQTTIHGGNAVGVNAALKDDVLKLIRG
jgi:histidinol-phosphatase